MAVIPKLLVVQRISLSHDRLMSRSIDARFGPLLAYMARHNMLLWKAIPETDISIDDLREFDVILFNKHTSYHALDLMRMANALGKKTIYDLDDWILDLPEYSVTSLAEDTLENIVCMIREATYVSVSNAQITKKIYTLRSDTQLILNGCDFEDISSQPYNWYEAQPPKILFSNTDDLKLISFREGFLETVRRFMNEHPDLTLEFWGDSFFEMRTITRLKPMGFLTNKEYKLAIREAGYIFAIVPLGGEEDPSSFFFNSCKSSIKYLDYGSLGIPAIYSRTPVYSTVVKHQQTGLLASNDSETWYREMSRLLSDHVLRQSIRKNSYNDVTLNHSITRSARVMADLLN